MANHGKKKNILAKDAVYFRHDYNARNDPKMISLRMKYGWEGYGIFWALMEIMREENAKLTLTDSDTFAFQLHLTPDKMKEYIEAFVALKLLIKVPKGDDSFVYSKRMRDDYDHMKGLSESARKAAEARWSKGKEDEQPPEAKPETESKADGKNAIAMHPHSERSTDADAGAMPNSINSIGEKSKEEEKKSEGGVVRTIGGTPPPPPPPEPPKKHYDAKASESYFLKKFNELTGKKHRLLSDKVKKELKIRVIKDGYTSTDILTAIKNCASDKYHKENNLKYLTPEFITRPDKLEMYLAKPTTPPASTTQGTADNPTTLSTLEAQQEYFSGMPANCQPSNN